MNEELRQYLAAHDATCPACSYNLRGLTGEVCPECSRQIRLWDLYRPRPARLTKFFWSALAADLVILAFILSAILVRAELRAALQAGVLLIIVWACFTLLFMLLPLIRRGTIDDESFVEELAWSIWIPLFLKSTCLAGMLV